MTTRTAAAIAATALAAAAIAIVGLPAASAAGTHSVTASMFCESWSSRVNCDSWQTGGVAPITRRWFINGVHVPAYDDSISVLRTCQPGTTTTFHLVVIAANGSAEVTRSPICRSGPPR
jgi:hypothetical protein